MRKNKFIGTVLVLSAIALSGCGKEKVFAFKDTITYINSGDKATCINSYKGDVIYTFQGGTPEGVTLDHKTGEITFDATGDVIPERVLIASQEGMNDVYTIIHFNLVEETPVINWSNVSKYLLNNDACSATAKGESGRSYGVTYELKDFVNGIVIEKSSGKVKYSPNVQDLTPFTVVAKSKDATSEKEFLAMTTGEIVAVDDTSIVKYGSDETATFTLDFGTNTAGDNETTAENIGYAYGGIIHSHPAGLTYNASTKEVTFSKEIIATLAKGENKISILTQRNAVNVNLVVCDNFISSGEEFVAAFTPTYGNGAPKFKRDSLKGYYVLKNDIDLSTTYKNSKGWYPIGAYSDQEYDVPFTGVFNGNGHTISGFTYAAPTAVNALFGRNTGTIKNFTLKGALPTMSSWSAAVCGNNGGTIENVIVDVEMMNGGQYATGTICSVNHGIISNCLSINTEVKGYTNTPQDWQHAGIAVGLNETDGTIEKVYAVSNYEGYSLFGWSQNTEITLSKAGRLFSSLEEMKAFDFSSVLNAKAFNFVEGELPTLKVGK